MSQKILVIDDDPNVGTILKTVLERAGYQVIFASSGAKGLERTRDSHPDLILLDIMMPIMDGWQTCQLLRQETRVPIIMLTAIGLETSLTKALELGADDYLTKPWSNRELLARIHAALRRDSISYASPWKHNFCQGGLEIDLAQREVVIDGKRLELTPIEFRLLAYLARRPGKVVSATELIAQIWGAESKGSHATLRVHVYNVRKKIERDPQNPRYLLAKRGMGYYLPEEK